MAHIQAMLDTLHFNLHQMSHQIDESLIATVDCDTIGSVFVDGTEDFTELVSDDWSCDALPQSGPIIPKAREESEEGESAPTSSTVSPILGLSQGEIVSAAAKNGYDALSLLLQIDDVANMNAEELLRQPEVAKHAIQEAIIDIPPAKRRRRSRKLLTGIETDRNSWHKYGQKVLKGCIAGAAVRKYGGKDIDGNEVLKELGTDVVKRHYFKCVFPGCKALKMHDVNETNAADSIVWYKKSHSEECSAALCDLCDSETSLYD